MEMEEHNHLVQVLYDDGKTETIDWTEHVAAMCVADIMVRCAICEEHVSMNSNDYRAQGVFICDKCKAAIKHVRDYLENGGSVT
jgi:hypothetical protein